jgi:type I restriction enzyme S subunit
MMRATKPTHVPWIGEVPATWSVAPLYARYSVQLGKMLNPEASSGAHQAPYLGNGDVQWGSVNAEDLSTMSFAPSERDRFRLRRGDLLVCEGGDVGRTAVWRDELTECFYQKALHRLRPRTSADDPQFFFYVMRSATGRGYTSATSSSGS